MKKYLVQLTSTSLLLVFVFSLMASSSAALPEVEVNPQASNYFSSSNLGLSAIGGGKVRACLNVTGVGKMQELGAADVYIYEVQKDGRYTQVAHYNRYSHTELIDKDTTQAIVLLTFQGVAGKKYYAEAKCYAKNSSGSNTRWVSSGIITAN